MQSGARGTNRAPVAVHDGLGDRGVHLELLDQLTSLELPEPHDAVSAGRDGQLSQSVNVDRLHGTIMSYTHMTNTKHGRRTINTVSNQAQQ